MKPKEPLTASKMWTVAKKLSLIVIFCLSFVSGISSYVAINCFRQKYGLSIYFKRVVSFLNCFSGGVFLATSLIHLLPEAREQMEKTLELWKIKTDYPLAEVLTGIGFSILLTFESLSFVCCSVEEHCSDSEALDKRGDLSDKTNGSIEADPQNALLQEPENSMQISNHNTDAEGETSYNCYQTNYGKTDATIVKGRDCVIETDNFICPTKNPSLSKENDLGERHPLLKDSGRNDLYGERTKKSLHVFDDKETINRTQSASYLRGFFFLLALSFHMVFDGMALGLQNKDEAVWTLLFALCCHKIFVFISIGFKMFEVLKSRCRAIFILTVLSAVSPLGIVIGVSITSNENRVSEFAASAVLQGLATGTFIYVTFLEILFNEFKCHAHDLAKVLSMVSGFVLVSAVKYLGSVNL